MPPGRYQIRVAAVGSDKTQGSVFTELTVPRFDAGLGVGGLSLGASPGPAASESADRLREVLPLVPFATREFGSTAGVEAQLPIRVSSKMARSPIALTTTLSRPDGTTIQLDRANSASAAAPKPTPHCCKNQRRARDAGWKPRWTLNWQFMNWQREAG